MKKTKCFRISCFLLSIMLVGVFLAGTPTAVYAATGVTQNEDNPSDGSFANMSSAASGAFMDVYFDEGHDLHFDEMFGTITAENAGGLLGFHNDTKHRSKSGILQQKSSNSSATLSYMAYMRGNLISTSGGSGSDDVFTPYLTFGAAMADLGLDTYASGVNAGTMSRTLAGSLVWIVYGFTTLIEQIFGMVINLLEMLNPFRLLVPSQAGTIWGHWGADPASGATVDAPEGVFADIAAIVSDVYNALHNMSWIVLTLILGFFFGAFFIFHKRMSDWSRWKKMLIRICFIFFGIPLLGGTYTALLEQMHGILTGGSHVSPGTAVIASTFVDFEGRVLESWRGLNVTFGTPIEVKYNVSGLEGKVKVSTKSTSAMRLCANWNSGVTGAPTSVLYPPGGDTDVNGLINTVKTSGSGAGSTTQIEWAKRVLKDYITGKTIDAEEYAGNYIAKAWSASGGYGVTQDQKKSQMTFMTSPAGIENEDGDVYGSHGGGLFDFPSGTITGAPIGNPFHSNHSGMSAVTCPAGGSGTGNFDHAAMSPMATYNYLNTEFGPTSATVYSSTEAASDSIKKFHYSVNLANDGVDGFCMIFMIIAMLACISVMGIVYAIGILFANIKRGIRLLVAMPGAMIGSLHAISRIISYVVIMLLEIIMTIMLYALFSDMLITIPMLLASNIAFTWATYLPNFAFILYLLIGAVFIWFTVMSIKYRAVILKAVETAGDNVVQQFVGLNDGAGAAMAHGMAGAGGAGAGGSASASGKRGLVSDGAASALGLAAGGLPGAMVGSKANRKLASLKDTGKEERKLSEVLGGSGSAMGDEKARDERIKGKIEARKKEATDKIMGGAQAAIGAAEIAGGAASGNPMLIANGAKQVAGGGKKLVKAGEERAATEERLDSLSEADLGGGNDTGTVNAPAGHGKSGTSPVSSAVGQAAGNVAGEAASTAGEAVGDAILPGSGAIVGQMAGNVANKEVSSKVSETINSAGEGGEASASGGKGMAPKNASGGSAINGGGGTVIQATETSTQAKVITSGGGGQTVVQPTATATPSMAGGGTVRPVASSSPVAAAAANAPVQQAAPVQGPQSAASAPQSAAGGNGNFVPTGGSYNGGSGSNPVAAASANEGGGGFNAGGGTYSGGNNSGFSAQGSSEQVHVTDHVEVVHDQEVTHTAGDVRDSGFNASFGEVHGQNLQRTVQDRMQIDHQGVLNETFSGNTQASGRNAFSGMAEAQNTSEFRSAMHEVIRSHRANIRDIYGGSSGGGAKPPVPDANADAS